MAKNSPDFDYCLMGVEVERLDEIQAGMESIILPQGQYIVLTIIKRGPGDVGQGFQFVYEEWLSQSAYRPTGSPGFIYNDERFFFSVRQVRLCWKSYCRPLYSCPAKRVDLVLSFPEVQEAGARLFSE